MRREGVHLRKVRRKAGRRWALQSRFIWSIWKPEGGGALRRQFASQRLDDHALLFDLALQVGQLCLDRWRYCIFCHGTGVERRTGEPARFGRGGTGGSVDLRRAMEQQRSDACVAQW